MVEHNIRTQLTEKWEVSSEHLKTHTNYPHRIIQKCSINITLKVVSRIYIFF